MRCVPVTAGRSRATSSIRRKSSMTRSRSRYSPPFAVTTGTESPTPAARAPTATLSSPWARLLPMAAWRGSSRAAAPSLTPPSPGHKPSCRLPRFRRCRRSSNSNRPPPNCGSKYSRVDPAAGRLRPRPADYSRTGEMRYSPAACPAIIGANSLADSLKSFFSQRSRIRHRPANPSSVKCTFTGTPGRSPPSGRGY